MMIKKTFTISLLLLLGQAVNQAIVFPAYANVQKCQDSQGKWHYGNDLRNVCKNEADIQAVKEKVKSPATAQNESASDRELTRLELKVLNETQYLVSELKAILAPYTTAKDVEDRFERLKSGTTAELSKKELDLNGLQIKQQALSSDKPANPEKSKVLIADIDLRIKSTEADIRQLNVKLEQIEQRRTKVASLFNEFKGKLDQEQAAQQG